MKPTARGYAIVTALAVFIGLPLLFYALGDTPRRSILKEALSILTLLSFTLMLGQFFLARGNETILSLFRPRQIRRVHKAIAYSAVGVMLAHPSLIVLPRYFEAGVKPWDAFIIMITTVDSLGVLLGMGAWVLLLVLAVTSWFRITLIQRFHIKIPAWRYFHGGLAVVFVTMAIWHAIELGRHTDTAMATFFITLALIGVALLVGQYWGAAAKRPTPTPISDGAQP